MATGGAGGGNGGYAEVSANPATHGVLNFVGGADLTAPKGAVGTLLLDPYDIVISTGTDSGGSFSAAIRRLGSHRDIGHQQHDPREPAGQFKRDRVHRRGGSPGSDAGNITVSAPISWSSNNGLTLTAANDIAINAPISVAGAGQLTLTYGTLTMPTNLSFGNAASVSYAVGTGEGIPGQALTINGVGYAPLFLERHRDPP